MKSVILTAIATSFTISAFAQATVVFNNHVSGTIVTHVYVIGGMRSQVGNGPSDTPSGSTDWTGFMLVGTTGSPLTAAGTFAQLLGAPGFNAPESSLIPGLGVTSFRTGAAAGSIVGTGATFNNIAPNAPAATLEMVAWDNSSGLYPTWAEASLAWKAGLTHAGTSGTWNQDAMGGTLPAPCMINSTDPSQHVRSFNIVIPEPTTVVLAGLGAAAILTFRRRK